MIGFDVAERRRRLAVRHALAPAARVPRPADVARRLVALHATDPATVFLSVAARTQPRATAAELESAIYDRRELVRMLGMRRTVFVLPAESVPVVQASTTERIAVTQRTLLLKHLSGAGGIEVQFSADSSAPAGQDLPEWLADVERSVLLCLAERGGTATAAELSAAEPRLRTTLLMAAGKNYEARQNITSRVLLILAAQGHLVRGRPIGSWLSQQYRWSLAEAWLRAAAPDQPASAAHARAGLARDWLRAYGPAPLTDLKWWTGWTMSEVRKAAAELSVVEVDMGAGSGMVLPDDMAHTPDPGPWAALLPALDPTVMGWLDRSWFLGQHGPDLFDTNGNAGPTVWLNGRIVGGWAQGESGSDGRREVRVALYEDVDRDGRALVAAEAARVADWLGEVRVIPRFRTPTERKLTEGGEFATARHIGPADRVG